MIYALNWHYSDPNGNGQFIIHKTRYTYDQFGHVLQVSNPNGTATQNITLFSSDGTKDASGASVNNIINQMTINYVSTGLPQVNGACTDIKGVETSCKVASITVNQKNLRTLQTDSYSYIGDNNATYYDVASQSTQRFYPKYKFGGLGQYLSDLNLSLLTNHKGGILMPRNFSSGSEFYLGGVMMTMLDATNQSTGHIETKRNGWGQVTSSINVLKDLKTTYTYTDKGQVKSTSLYNTKTGSDVLVKTTTNIYDANGNVTSSKVTDANNQTATLLNQQTTNLGFVLSKNLNNNKASEYHYITSSNADGMNSLGQLLKTINPDGSSVNYQYNTDGQISQVQGLSPTGQAIDTTHYTYQGPFGRLNNVSNANGDYTYTEDSMGRTSQIKNSISGLTETYAYHGLWGTLASTTLQNSITGVKTEKVYDINPETGLLNQIVISGDVNGEPLPLRASEYLYDLATGQLTLTTKGVYDPISKSLSSEDQTVGLKYTALDQLAAVYNILGSKTKKYTYQYGPSGRIATKTSPGHTESYQYTDYNQIAKYRCDGVFCPTNALGYQYVSQDYQYDGFGNLDTITQMLKGSAQTGDIQNTEQYTYNPNHMGQLATIKNTQLSQLDQNFDQYDATGNLTESHQWTNGVQSTEHYTYTPFDKVNTLLLDTDQSDHIQQINFGYGPMGKAVKQVYPLTSQTLENNYVDGKLYSENLNNNSQLISSRVYVPNGEYYISTQQNGKNIQWQDNISDGHNLLGLYTPKSTLVETHQYSPYGVKATSQASVSQKLGAVSPIGISLKDTDLGYNSMPNLRGVENTQNLGNGVRLYNGQIKMFTQNDPTMADANGYAYSNNNPANGYDPSGYSFESFWKNFGVGLGDVFTNLIGYDIGSNSWSINNETFVATGELLVGYNGKKGEYVGVEAWGKNITESFVSQSPVLTVGINGVARGKWDEVGQNLGTQVGSFAQAGLGYGVKSVTADISLFTKMRGPETIDKEFDEAKAERHYKRWKDGIKKDQNMIKRKRENGIVIAKVFAKYSSEKQYDTIREEVNFEHAVRGVIEEPTDANVAKLLIACENEELDSRVDIDERQKHYTKAVESYLEAEKIAKGSVRAMAIRDRLDEYRANAPSMADAARDPSLDDAYMAGVHLESAMLRVVEGFGTERNNV